VLYFECEHKLILDAEAAVVKPMRVFAVFDAFFANTADFYTGNFVPLAQFGSRMELYLYF